MERYRRFTDQAGRKHRIPLTDDEIRERWMYGIGFGLVCILWAVAMTIASGILN